MFSEELMRSHKMVKNEKRQVQRYWNLPQFIPKFW